MSNKNLPKHELTIIADDFREEARNKISLMGVYGKDIHISTPPPAVLSKLCFFTRLTGGEGRFKIRYSIKDPDGKEVLGRSSELLMNAKTNLDVNLNLSVVPFNISKEGEYKFIIFIDGKEISSMKFNIKYVSINSIPN